MRVLVPYARLHPSAEAALVRHAPTAEFIYVGGDQTAYHRLVSAAWANGRDFVLIEHDIEVHEQVLPQFMACPELWCVFAYPLARRPDGSSVYLDHSLGCARFRARLLAEHPKPFAGLPGYHWAKVDADLQAALAPLEPHLHLPPVAHHKGGEVLR
jgi:hypothetical protein